MKVIAGYCTSPGRWWSLLTLQVCLLALPLFLIDYPPLMDLPNHMARLYILSTHDSDPVLSRMWHSEWRLVPNLAIDLIGPTLVAMTSLVTTARILLILIIVLFVMGSALLNWAIFGRRSYWPFLSGLTVYNGVFLLGFMNYLLGVGIALCGAAAWITHAPLVRRYRNALSCLFAVATFFSHIFALMFYLMFIGCWQLAQATEKKWNPGNLRQHILPLLPAVTVAASLVIFYLTHAAHLGPHLPLVWSSLKEKAIYLLLPFLNYSAPLDIATTVLCASGLAFMWSRGTLEVPRGIKFLLALLFMLYLLCPQGAAGGYVDSRFTLLFAIVAIAGTCPRELDARARGVIYSACGVILAVRLCVLGSVWVEARQDLKDFRSLEAFIPRGARILAAIVTKEEDKVSYHRDQPASRELRGMASLYYHLPALWVIDRQAFWPLLFINPSQQPMRAQPPYDQLSATFGVPPDYRELAETHLSQSDAKNSPYLPGWENRFDFIVVLSAARAKHIEVLEHLPLKLLAKTDIAYLYKIQGQ